MEKPKIKFESSMDELENVHYATEEEHKNMMDVMSQYFDMDPPQVGIFWYDVENHKLFGVSKGDADIFINDRIDGTIHKLHKTFWQNQHYRAVTLKQTDSIYYNEHNYTNIPRGCVFVRPDGSIYVAVGNWFYGDVNGVKIDSEALRELIADEFNLPEDFDVVIDEHWNLGYGWSGDKF